MNGLRILVLTAAAWAAFAQTPACGLPGDLVALAEGTLINASDLPEDVAPETPALRFTVGECVDRALAENPRLHRAAWEVEAAEARAGQARSPFFPQISAASAYTRLDEAPSLGRFGDVLLGDQYSPEKTTRTDRFTVEQLFFAGGRVRAGARGAAHLAQAQAWQRQAVEDELVLDARRAFYDCLLAESLVRVAENSVRAFERHEEDARQKLDAGLASEFELLRAQTELEARRSGLVAAHNGRRLAFANLRRLLDLPQDTPVELVGRLAWKPLDASVNELVAEAFMYRPELHALREGIGGAEQEVRRASGSYLPRVGGRAEWTNTDGGGGFTPEGWAFSIGADWELFSGFRRRYETAEARAVAKSLAFQENELARLVELEVHHAYIQVQDALAQIQTERATVALGSEGLRLAMLRFQEGVGIQAETLDAELALSNAERGLVQALRNYAVAQAALDRAAGRGYVSPDEVIIKEGAPLP